MRRAHAEASALIDAPAAEIYAVLTDYGNAHPHILPKPYFTKLAVEQGGIGAGTIIRTHMRVFVTERIVRQRVSEPEPGRVLVEQDMDADLATTFTVTPVADGQQAQVTITTDWAAKAGIMGWIEQTLTRRMLQSIYIKELRQLADYVKRR